MSNQLTKLQKLLTKFSHLKNVTPLDFIEELTKDIKETDVKGDDTIYDVFLQFVSHDSFLDKLALDFKNKRSIKLANHAHMKQVIFFIMFLLKKENTREINGNTTFYIKPLLEFLSSDEIYPVIATIACSYFENDYALNKIIYPLMNKAPLIQQVLQRIEKDEKPKVVKVRPIPVQKDRNSFELKVPRPPFNTPKCLSDEKMRPVMSYKPRQADMEKLHQENYKKALGILEEASKVSKRLTEPKKIPPPEPVQKYIIKPKKVPPKRDVEIKGNLTTTLREAARLLKERDDEVNKIEDLIRGGCDHLKVLELEDQERRDAERKEVEDIQRKHLQGLLTYEEAILAKKKVVEVNKMKTLEMKLFKMDLADQLEKWKEEQNEKIKAQVERCQKLRQDTKEREKKMQEEKQEQVRMLQYETKVLLKNAFEEQAKELARKVDLINEIKTLHEVAMRVNAEKEFDPTETPNLGLMCEMSIAELQERLAIVRCKMKEELEEKRKNILKRKTEQQDMLDNLKQFIEDSKKTPKCKSVTSLMRRDSITVVESNPELAELRRKLEEKRSMRMKTVF
ncbi:unnamed protein product [Acanthoscelides obtectus]|uniref:Cilia- and flagella-associated protein 99 n=1 Tax=Acanthoscelides obtectus TaxID=200917 RepID=A0A9P0KA84_ACAOB|nr:unnamed protein product [Acanthoscelides obtectus]CAK1653214.1 Cilia- and flagella-associated protein 99 [Acanthoscelides obtectus]